MLKSHMQSVHEGVIFKCDQCTECIVKTKKGLKKHVLSKHPSPEQKANPLLCTEDEYTLLTVADINMKSRDAKSGQRGQHACANFFHQLC